jgi:hypothetical protein
MDNVVYALEDGELRKKRDLSGEFHTKSEAASILGWVLSV